MAEMAHMELKMGILSALLRDLGDFFWILGAILPKLAKTRKTMTVHHFCKVFGDLGGLLEAMLAHLGAMLSYVGPSWRQVWPSWPILPSSCDLLARRLEKDTEDEVR